MGVVGLDHVNIRTLDVAASAKFYEEVLGLTYQQGPAIMGGHAHWLYDDDGNALIHFRVMEPGATHSGAIDHVALRCRDRARVKARLDELEIEYTEADNLVPGVVQIFFPDPHGVMLELNFADG
ncbi:VOC family protein [Sphingomonas sp. LaA6.9]|uniref:VOC family protein n=1 Tax=Sphingomonas sp. LaA6.9 TaxID=2919914 RepID=UPI001F4F8317|nr:VOC family protein [Sphingomonas sp. LaA6.9]MCJ8155794.1 VOC family protein [Sphingomonas sp. LaA6.9]